MRTLRKHTHVAASSSSSMCCGCFVCEHSVFITALHAMQTRSSDENSVRDRMSVTRPNRKSHTGFRLVPTSMTLNDLERRNSLYFAFFSRNSTDFQADYITMVEDRPIMSVKYCLPVPVSYFWRKL